MKFLSAPQSAAENCTFVRRAGSAMSSRKIQRVHAYTPSSLAFTPSPLVGEGGGGGSERHEYCLPYPPP